MKNKVVLIAMLLCAATILTSCGKNVKGKYVNDDGYVLVIDKTEWAISGGEKQIKGIYDVKGNEIKFTPHAFTDESTLRMRVETGTIDGDNINIQGFDKPFIRKEKY